MALEYLAGRLSHHDTHDLNETATSFVVAVGNKIVRVIEATVIAVPFVFAYNNRIFEIDSTSWAALILLFFLVEFVYYWHHRASHTVRWLWATHVVHHSPTRYNLTAAIRLGWTGAISGHFLFYVPLALIGFHPMAIAAILGANLGYQFFLHSELVPRLGLLELVLNTPTHHRVHHACNTDCLDKNFGGTLIVFDRLFGTFARPPQHESLRYGIVGRAYSNNPIDVIFGEWFALAGDLRGKKFGSADWFAVLLGRPKSAKTENIQERIEQRENAGSL
ncbi:MAG: sterol desaturase family protein [Pseudomonadota bacterium]